MSPLQESQVGWDLRHIDSGVQWHDSIFVLILWGSVLWGIWIIVRLLFRLGLSSRKTHRVLDKLLNDLNPDSWKKVSALAGGFSKRDPERGIREVLENLNQSTLAVNLTKIKTADALFQYEMATSQRLCRLLGFAMGFLGLVCASYVFLDMENLLKTLLISKAIGGNAILSELRDASALLSVALGVIISLFVVQGFFSSMLNKRNIYWDYFIAKLESKLEGLQGNFKQP